MCSAPSQAPVLGYKSLITTDTGILSSICYLWDRKSNTIVTYFFNILKTCNIMLASLLAFDIFHGTKIKLCLPTYFFIKQTNRRTITETHTHGPLCWNRLLPTHPTPPPRSANTKKSKTLLFPCLIILPCQC
jgi:hypothetical protein